MSERVLITGAASGIGAAAAEVMRGQGARVIGLDRQQAGEDVLACDVRDQAEVDRAVREAVERLRGLDVLINNAGVGFPQKATLPPGEDALAVIDINLMGAWRVTAAALTALRAARGRVVNVASGLVFITVPLAPAYCMSKRGLVGYSDALRLEIGHEIEVTTVYPGYVKTPIHDASIEQGFGLEGLVPEEPLEAVTGRVAQAALGPHVRDLATTRQGTLSYAVARRVPRRLIDRVTLLAVARQARSGKLDRSPLAGELAQALKRR